MHTQWKSCWNFQDFLSPSHTSSYICLVLNQHHKITHTATYTHTPQWKTNYTGHCFSVAARQRPVNHGGQELTEKTHKLHFSQRASRTPPLWTPRWWKCISVQTAHRCRQTKQNQSRRRTNNQIRVLRLIRQRGQTASADPAAWLDELERQIFLRFNVAGVNRRTD